MRAHYYGCDCPNWWFHLKTIKLVLVQPSRDGKNFFWAFSNSSAKQLSTLVQNFFRPSYRKHRPVNTSYFPRQRRGKCDELSRAKHDATIGQFPLFLTTFHPLKLLEIFLVYLWINNTLFEKKNSIALLKFHNKMADQNF